MERRCHKCNTCCQLENNTPKKSKKDAKQLVKDK